MCSPSIAKSYIIWKMILEFVQIYVELRNHNASLS